MTTSAWTPRDAAARYNLDHWGDGYFGVGDQGHLQVRPFRDRSPVTIDLYRLARQLPKEGLDLPVLVRFTDILRDRVDMLCDAFAGVIADYAYEGQYTAVYPIKVNQQESVVEAIVAHGGARVGIEAGSKPELAAVLGLAPPGPSKPSRTQPSAHPSRTTKQKVASRAGETLINFARLETGWLVAPQKWCSHARETASFSKRYAPVYVKRPFVK